MSYQDQLLEFQAQGNVVAPVVPNSLVTPEVYFVEYGRNKMVGEKNIFSRNDYREVTRESVHNTTQQFIHDPRNQSWGLYMTAFEYDSPDPYTANVRGDFFLDFDDEDDIRKAQQDALRIVQHLALSPNFKIPLNMIRMYFSGKKGIHVTIPYQCFGINWHPELHEVYRTIATELQPFAPNGTLDMSVYEKRRLFRIPRSRHASTGCFKVPMELKNLVSGTEDDIRMLSRDPNYGSHISYEEARFIPEAARYFRMMDEKTMQRFNKRFSNGSQVQTLDFQPPCYTEMIADGPVKGSRNAVGTLLVSFWRQRGLTEQEAWDNLVAWNEDSMGSDELSVLFKSMYHGKYTFGCSKIKELAHCPATCKADCKFFKN